MLITARNYPAIFDVMETIMHDGGGRAGHKAYRLGLSIPEAINAEQDLQKLTDDERQAFAIGEETEMAEIANRTWALTAVGQAIGVWCGTDNTCACAEAKE
ncbi:hypothetical protein [Parvularcula sp. LCG005]|uniref:hypothetical protein n=1 Tax=Parvularcula sp. LCG005 TaxID=3078805 RepID=UPI0029433A3B|nr:hypothetical protein [Parvularcula sp. LCG005]WOI54276.1 hypothetical protein RUI03_04570 [Parvularcula sp. LCG005]